MGAPPSRPAPPPLMVFVALAKAIATPLGPVPPTTKAPVAAVAAGEELVADRLMLLFTLLDGVVVADDGDDVVPPIFVANMAAAAIEAVPLQVGIMVKGPPAVLA